MPRRTTALLAGRLAVRAAYDMNTMDRASQIPEEQRDQWIEWRASSVSVLRHYVMTATEERAVMQRQFTIELRVDFADPDKLEPLKQVLQQAARHAFATAQLISDNPKLTKIAIFSDDFFTGHEQIALLDDTIQQGLDSIGENTGSETISSELAMAAKGFNDGITS